MPALPAAIPLPMPAPEKAGPALIDALHWVFDRITRMPGPGLLTEKEINRRIAFYCTGAGAAGFVTNMGGVFTLPVALPANLVSLATIQLKLISEIAVGRGYDLADEEIRTVAVACLAGQSALDLVKDAGIQLGVRMTERAVSQLAGASLARLNQAVGTSIVAKAGTSGMAKLTRIVPFVGGLVGGTIDAASTRAVAEIAKRAFIRRDPGPAAA